jgi:hypothetical protein
MQVKKPAGRKKSEMRKNVAKKVREKIRRNPGRSIRKLAKDYGISLGLMWNVVRKDLKMFPYKIQKRQQLSDQNKAVRQAKSKALLRRHASAPSLPWLFSDEKLFIVERSVNKQNDRVLARDLEGATRNGRLVGRRAHAPQVMVFAAITSDGK